MGSYRGKDKEIGLLPTSNLKIPNKSKIPYSKEETYGQITIRASLIGIWKLGSGTCFEVLSLDLEVLLGSGVCFEV
jgi:hypothetical protein